VQGGSPIRIYGLDLNPEFLKLAMRISPGAWFCLGDAHALPFASRMFDLALCHFLLLWVANPLQVIHEMARVTAPGGAVLALAEPDYSGRIDYPDRLSILGKWQQQALVRQGADPEIGRRLGEIFLRAGLESVEVGVLGGQWAGKPAGNELESEWKVLESDLAHLWDRNSADFFRELERLKTADLAAWDSGERVLFVPTFYAWGRVSAELPRVG
jgi:SAM-dependent methyltransferase